MPWYPLTVSVQGLRGKHNKLIQFAGRIEGGATCSLSALGFGITCLGCGHLSRDCHGTRMLIVCQLSLPRVHLRLGMEVPPFVHLGRS